jgi:RNA polymerase sigma factor (sigma-70 family)
MTDADEFRSLMARLRQGDQQAAAELVRKHESLIRREVRLRLEDQRLQRALDSMDVCQSVLASFFVRTAVGEYDLTDPRQLIRLLVTMTKNKVASAARREYRQKRDQRRNDADDVGLLAVAAHEATPSEIVAGRELLDRVRTLFSPEEAQISDLRGQGHSWEEIASQLGGTAQSKRVQFSRALERINKQLGFDEEQDG